MGDLLESPRVAPPVYLSKKYVSSVIRQGIIEEIALSSKTKGRRMPPILEMQL
jgi:hypothetical protein